MLCTCHHCHTEYDTDNVLIPCRMIWERNTMRCPKCGIEADDCDDYLPWIGLTVSQFWEAKIFLVCVAAVIGMAVAVSYAHPGCGYSEYYPSYHPQTPDTP